MGESPERRAGQDRDLVRMAAIEGDGCEERARNVVRLGCELEAVGVMGRRAASGAAPVSLVMWGGGIGLFSCSTDGSSLLHFAQNAGRDHRMKNALAARSRPYCRYQFLRAGVLEQVRESSGFDNAEDLVVFVIRGENDDLRHRGDALDLAHCRNPIHTRHQQIEQHHVGQEAGCQGHTLYPIAALAYNLYVRLLLQQKTQSMSDHCMVIHNNYANHTPAPLVDIPEFAFLCRYAFVV